MHSRSAMTPKLRQGTRKASRHQNCAKAPNKCSASMLSRMTPKLCQDRKKVSKITKCVKGQEMRQDTQKAPCTENAPRHWKVAKKQEKRQKTQNASSTRKSTMTPKLRQDTGEVPEQQEKLQRSRNASKVTKCAKAPEKRQQKIPQKMTKTSPFFMQIKNSHSNQMTPFKRILPPPTTHKFSLHSFVFSTNSIRKKEDQITITTKKCLFFRGENGRKMGKTTRKMGWKK